MVEWRVPAAPCDSSVKSMSLPVLKWTGGKRWLTPYLLEIISRASFGRYFEPFCGGAALFFQLAPKHAILSDTNNDLINCYKQIRDDPESEKKMTRSAATRKTILT
jgi:DNA adenine methylase